MRWFPIGINDIITHPKKNNGIPGYISVRVNTIIVNVIIKMAGDIRQIIWYNPIDRNKFGFSN